MNLKINFIHLTLNLFNVKAYKNHLQQIYKMKKISKRQKSQKKKIKINKKT